MPADPGGDNAARSTRMLRLTRLARFARLAKLSKLTNLRKLGAIIMRFLQNVGVSRMGLEFVFTMGTLCFILLATMHILGCLFLNIGRGHAAESEGWLLYAYGEDAEVYGNATHQDMYINALYFMIVTMSSTGYGDLLPKTPGEKVYLIFVIFVGSFVYAYIIGSFSTTLSHMSSDRNAFEAKMRSVQTLMQYLNVAPDLEFRVKQYYEFKFSTKTLFSDHDIFDELPAKIRQDLVLHRYEHVIDKVPFFKGLREDAIVDICSQLRLYSVMPLDYIVQRGDAHRELVILMRGVARSVPPDEEEATALAAPALSTTHVMVEYPTGSFFGELEFLGFSEERTVSVRAKRYCEVASLHPNGIESVLQVHVKLRRRLQKYGLLREELNLATANGSMTDVQVEEMKQALESQFSDEDAEIKNTFEYYDDDDSGELEADEIKALIMDMGGGDLSEEDIISSLRKVDKTGTGVVTFEQFKEWWEVNDATFKIASIGAETLEENKMDKNLKKTENLLDNMSKQVNAELELVGKRMDTMEQKLGSLCDDFGQFVKDMKK